MSGRVAPHSQRVIARRVELGWTQTRLSLESGVHQSTISEIEGGAWPRDRTKTRLAAALGVSPHTLWPLHEAPARRAPLVEVVAD